MIAWILSLYIMFGAAHAPCFISQEMADAAHIAAHGDNEIAVDTTEEWIMECRR